MRSADRAIVLVTHYQRLLDYIVPDQVHVLAQGRIVRSGSHELALELERKGYGWLGGQDGDGPAAGQGAGTQHTAAAREQR
jgi:Fe-S cluster assembly ATP-binding protein